MSSISLQKFGSQAMAGIYAGAETILGFGSIAEELNAIRHSCGVFDLGWRGKLVVSGEDRVRWLNGMLTNNTRDLSQDFGNYNFILNAQGRIQGDLLAFQRGEFYILETEAGQVSAIRDFLERYIIMDEVELGDISHRLTSIGVAGPGAEEILKMFGMAPGAARPGQVIDSSWQGIGFSLVRDPIESRNWYELWLAPENVEALWTALVEAGAKPVGAEALEWQRILLGLPRVGIDIGTRELPQETGQEAALHFSKGCYIGQEIVERIHSRGQVHRRFTGLILEDEPAAAGSKIMANAAEIGEITTSARIIVDGITRNLALGYVRHAESLKNGDPIPNEDMKHTVNGKPVTISELPFQL